jgi:hypothetical protein
LQLNPRNQATYRKLSDHYRSLGLINEAEAYLELMRKKFDGNSKLIDQKQSINDSSHP